MYNLNGKIIIGGVGAFVVLWILMQYNMKLAWLYLAVLLISILMIYRDIIFGQIAKISALLKS